MSTIAQDYAAELRRISCSLFQAGKIDDADELRLAAEYLEQSAKGVALDDDAIEARLKDLSVLWPLAISRTTRRLTPFVVEMRRIPFDQQKQVLKYICDRMPRFSASKHDATGLGMSIAEYAVQQYGLERTEAVSLNVPWYRDNAQPLKTAFEDDAIEIPADSEIHSDLRLVKTKGGVPFVPALKSGEDKNRHGDAAVALMLAYAATRALVALYDYESASTLRESSRGEDAAEAEDMKLPQEGLY